MSTGPGYWSNYPFRSQGVWLDGVQIEDGAAYPLSSLAALSGSVALDTIGNTQIVQTRYLGAKAPVGVSAGEIKLRMNVKNEADYALFLSRCERGLPIDFWPDWPLFEQWYLPLRDAGQTEFQPRRKFPWDISGITHSNRPPLAEVDGTPKTIVTTGTPTTSEIKVPESGGFGVVTANSAMTGTWLRVAFAPVFSVLITNVGMAYPSFNALEFDVSMVEVVQRSFN